MWNERHEISFFFKLLFWLKCFCSWLLWVTKRNGNYETVACMQRWTNLFLWVPRFYIDAKTSLLFKSGTNWSKLFFFERTEEKVQNTWSAEILSIEPKVVIFSEDNCAPFGPEMTVVPASVSLLKWSFSTNVRVWTWKASGELVLWTRI